MRSRFVLLIAVAGCAAAQPAPSGSRPGKRRPPSTATRARSRARTSTPPPPACRGVQPSTTTATGIANGVDRCPRDPGVRRSKAARRRAQIQRRDREDRNQGEGLLDTDQSTIQPRSYGLLDDVAALLVANPKVGPIVVEGHTDDRGSAELNRALSQARAEAVKAYLVGKGVGASRLEAKGFGPDRPAQPNTTDEGSRRTAGRVRYQGEVGETPPRGPPPAPAGGPASPDDPAARAPAAVTSRT